MTEAWPDQVLIPSAVRPLDDKPGRAPLFTAVSLPEDADSRADEAYHDDEAPRYDSYGEAVRVAVAERAILDWIRRRTPEGVAVDLGCGTGRITRLLAGPTRRVVAVDRSRGMLEQARDAVPADDVVLVRGDARVLPLRDGAVDAVVCSGVLHHLPHWRDAVREAARVLRPGGVLIVREPNVDYPERLFAPAERAMAALARRVWPTDEPAWSPEDVSAFSPVEKPLSMSDLSRCAERHGLRPGERRSAMFLGSLGIPEAVPGQRVYFEVARLLDRGVLPVLPGHRGALVLAVFARI